IGTTCGTPVASAVARCATGCVSRNRRVGSSILALRACHAMRMMTIVTHVSLKQGSEPDWDAAMRERLAAAAERPGWVGGQPLMPPERLNRRLIVGTWPNTPESNSSQLHTAF